MTFNINDYWRDYYCMHCKTGEEAKNFCQYLDKNGKHWRDGSSYTNSSHWIFYKEDTVYYFNKGMLGKKGQALKRGCIILEWSDFMKDIFSKSDLKSGMVVEYANGYRNLVVGDKIMRQNGYMPLKEYNEDLTCDDEEFDINKVYESRGCNFNTIFKNEYLNFVWERKQPLARKLTLKELEKILGYKVEIVSD